VSCHWQASCCLLLSAGRSAPVVVLLRSPPPRTALLALRPRRPAHLPTPPRARHSSFADPGMFMRSGKVILPSSSANKEAAMMSSLAAPLLSRPDGAASSSLMLQEEATMHQQEEAGAGDGDVLTARHSSPSIAISDRVADVQMVPGSMSFYDVLQKYSTSSTARFLRQRLSARWRAPCPAEDCEGAAGAPTLRTRLFPTPVPRHQLQHAKRPAEEDESSREYSSVESGLSSPDTPASSSYGSCSSTATIRSFSSLLDQHTPAASGSPPPPPAPPRLYSEGMATG
jgi:hypothetical protein